MVTYEGGIWHEYDYKLIGDLGGIIVGYSGSRGTFEIFRTRIRDYMIDSNGATQQKPHVKINRYHLRFRSQIF